jgi:CheY-like chemotaxis protein
MARILLIDDEDGVRAVTTRMLTGAGHEVAAYASGRAALAAAEAAAFDLVLTDVLMPDMDGVEILRAFSKRAPRPRLVVMTGGSAMLGMDLLSIAPALGADGTIAKPFRAKDLVAAVTAALAGTPALAKADCCSTSG